MGVLESESGNRGIDESTEKTDPFYASPGQLKTPVLPVLPG